jgi:hypothetical protein
MTKSPTWPCIAFALCALSLQAMAPEYQKQLDQATKQYPPGDYNERPVERWTPNSYKAAPTRWERKLSQITISSLEYKETPIFEAFQIFADQCAKAAPDAAPIQLSFDLNTLVGPAGGKLRKKKITASFKEASAIDILDGILQLSDLWYEQHGSLILIKTLEPKAAKN